MDPHAVRDDEARRPPPPDRRRVAQRCALRHGENRPNLPGGLGAILFRFELRGAEVFRQFEEKRMDMTRRDLDSRAALWILDAPQPFMGALVRL
jgi:hypothetical protein